MNKPISRHASEYFVFERADLDLQFYRGQPVAISPIGWCAVLASLTVAFAALILGQLYFNTGFLAFIPALLFAGIPLVTLGLVAGRQAPTALFLRLRHVDLFLILAFFAINAVVTVLVGLLVTRFFDAAANPVGTHISQARALDQMLLFGWAAIQLLGEEIFTILPFLAVLTALDGRMPRKIAICLAALSAAVLFAVIHLPTYQWNAAQALTGLVPIRIVLLLPYIITRNIWVSTGTHILNDWAIFALTLISPALNEAG